MSFKKWCVRNLIAIALISPSAMSSAQPAAKRDIAPDITIDLVVDNAEKASVSADKIVKNNGGKIEKRQIWRDQYNNQTATYIIVAAPNAVDDMMEKFRQLGSVRGENSEVNADLTSVRIKLSMADQRNENFADSRSQGRLFAGVAAANLNLNLSNDKSRSMSGAGITLSPRGQWAQLSIILLKETKKESGNETSASATAKEPNSSGSSIVLIGHNFYSSIFGGGYRSFANPYAGLTYGYSRLFSRSLFAIGGTIGLELVKLPWFTWSVSSNLMGLYSGKDGGNTTMYATHLFIPF
jgi:hypothetical protein